MALRPMKVRTALATICIFVILQSLRYIQAALYPLIMHCPAEHFGSNLIFEVLLLDYHSLIAKEAFLRISPNFCMEFWVTFCYNNLRGGQA